MQAIAGAFLLLLIGSMIWAVRRYRSSGVPRLADLGVSGARWDKPTVAHDRLVTALLPLVYGCLFAVYLGQVASMPFDDWNAARLSPVMALKYGYRLYYPPDDGPLLGMLYGPVTAVAYLPALAARTPTAAILIAGCLSVAFVGVPLGILCFGGVSNGPEGEGRDFQASRPLAGALTRPTIAGHVGFVFALAALLLHANTRYIATSIHADAPAVGLGLAACAVVMGAGRQIGPRRVILAAALAVLAAFSKQFEVVLVAALAAYLGVAFGIRPAVGFLLSAAVIASVLAGFFGLLWGFEAMAQSTVFLPIRLPRREWLDVAGDFYRWLKESAAVGLIVMVGLLARLQRTGGDGRGAWVILLRSPVGVLIFAVAALVPASIASVARFGAEANSNHWTYFLIGAASVMLSRVGCGGGMGSLSALGQRHSGKGGQAAHATQRELSLQTGCLLRRASYVIAAGAVCLVLPELYRLHWVETLNTNPARQAYVFAKNHPDAAYFPWHPLSTLMADGKAYHFEYGVFDRELVGARPSDEHFRQYLPSGLRYVVLRGGREQMITLTRQYLPEFSQRATLPELPGWTVFTRVPPSAANNEKHKADR